MTDDRIAQLERTLAQMDAELQATRRRLAAVETETGRATLRSWVSRPAMFIALGGLALVAALGLGTASAAPQALTLKDLKITDSNGAPVIELNNQGVSVYRGRDVLAKMGTAIGGGGLISVSNGSGERVGALQGRQSYGELVVGGPDGRARLGVDQGTTNQTLRFYNGNKVAGVGDVDGSGLLQINDATGNKMATLNDNGQPAITFKAQSNGGYFALTNASGMARVEAGIH